MIIECRAIAGCGHLESDPSSDDTATESPLRSIETVQVYLLLRPTSAGSSDKHGIGRANQVGSGCPTVAVCLIFMKIHRHLAEICDISTTEKSPITSSSQMLEVISVSIFTWVSGVGAPLEIMIMRIRITMMLMMMMMKMMMTMFCTAGGIPLRLAEL